MTSTEIAYYIVGEFPASIHRQRMGHLCGYIGVPKSHPWYGLKEYPRYDDETDEPIGPSLDDVNVHGGVTYAKAEIDGYPHDTGLDIWWVGFDCAHYMDIVPDMENMMGISPMPGATYKDEAYVRSEIESLAAQAAAAMVDAATSANT